MARRYVEKQKPENIVSTVSRLLKYMTNKPFVLVIVMLCTIGSAIASIVSTYMISPLLNNYIVPNIGATITAEIKSAFLMQVLKLFAVYLVAAGCSFASAKIMVKITNGTLNALRNDLFGRMQDLPISYFDSHTHGELMSHYTNDVDAVRDAISSGITTFMSSTVSIIGTLAMMIYISPIMTCSVLIIVVVVFYTSKFIGSKSIKAFKTQQAAVAKLNGYMEEMMQGQKVVKVFTHEEIIKEEFGKINEQSRKASTAAQTFSGIMGPISNNLSHLNYALTAIIGCYFCISGKLDIGNLASFLIYTRNFSNPVSMIMQRFNSLMSAVAGAERIFKVIDMPKENNEGKVTLVNAKFENEQLVECTERTGIWAWKKPTENGYQLIELKGDVRFENVVFSYDGKKEVLHGVSFYGNPGQKIAFVGSTGAGKTTITNLINRFYDIQSGRILYDGIDVKDIEKSALRSSLSIVLQDTHLFTGSVKDNIRYGKLDASDEEIIAAAKLANADDFINMLPDGYDTILKGDGANLSQGQRQLLSIARAAVANAPVLILDEATSSIDTRTEALIEKGMDNLMKGRTVFVIAHRLSTVRNSNAIMVLENGEIIERGNHESLLAQGGQYYRLYTGQLELD